MKNLINLNQMSSKQIADLTKKNHSDVMRNIRDEIGKLDRGGEITESKFALSEYKDSTGRKLPMYILSMEGILQLAARYDAVTRSQSENY